MNSFPPGSLSQQQRIFSSTPQTKSPINLFFPFNTPPHFPPDFVLLELLLQARHLSFVNLSTVYVLPFLFLFCPPLIIPVIFLRTFFFLFVPLLSNYFDLENGKASLMGSRDINGHGHSYQLGAENGMDYWSQRCSICFDQQLDLVLEGCRDQYCMACFRRYVTEVVNNSWGLNITKIKCPVCSDVIPQYEWSRYVSSQIVETYNKYNAPHRSFSRTCPTCTEEIVACKVKRVYGFEREKQFKEIHAALKALLLPGDASNEASTTTPSTAKTTSAPSTPTRTRTPPPSYSISDKDELLQTKARNLLARFDVDYTACLKGGNITVSEIYRTVTQDILEWMEMNRDIGQNFAYDGNWGCCSPGALTRGRRRRMEGHMEILKGASELSARLVSLEGRAEQWKELMFLHVARFPWVNCSNCSQEVCLSCGEDSHHIGMSCHEYLRQKSLTTANSVESQTLKYKLEKTRACPNCRILISRDEGCNKVDCLYCGYRFCWVCRSCWSEKCGFYKCYTLSKDDEVMLEEVETPPNDKPEIGVPNVILIQAKLSPV